MAHRFRSWFDKPVLSNVEGLTTNGGDELDTIPVHGSTGSPQTGEANRTRFPFVVSLSNHERLLHSPFVVSPSLS